MELLLAESRDREKRLDYRAGQRYSEGRNVSDTRIPSVPKAAPPRFPNQAGRLLILTPSETSSSDLYNPDVLYSIAPPVVTDSEGHPIDPPPVLTFTVVSDNPDAVAVTPDDPANPLAGSVHFGAPGSCKRQRNRESGRYPRRFFRCTIYRNDWRPRCHSRWWNRI